MLVDYLGGFHLLIDVIRLIVNSHFGKRSTLMSGFLYRTNHNTSTGVSLSVAAIDSDG
jgi:hypothetical protein